MHIFSKTRLLLKSHYLVSLFFFKRAISSVLSKAMAEVSSVKRVADEDPKQESKRLCQIDATQSSIEKIRRRKVILLLGYCGQGYLGMQRNVGFKTIEEDLLIALRKAELIKEEEFSQIQNLQFQRAARTDKGVSAVRQVVSLKLPENASMEAINKCLPDAIRIFALRRVTKGFNSKSSCDARTYSYMMPTSAFCDTNDPETYRITPDIIEKINTALKIFLGTHNFHNFTAKKKAQDPSAFRYIINFECGTPVIKDGMEFIVLQVKGQSFMLHQIRKMVGTVIAIVRGLATPETIIKAWGEPRFDLPIAPGLGLVLEQVHYDRYNAKFGKDGMHESLSWDDLEEDIATFKQKLIDPVIVQTEKNERSMHTWVQTLSFHTFDIRDYHRHEVLKNGDEMAVETKVVTNTDTDEVATSEEGNGNSVDATVVMNTDVKQPATP